MQDNPHAADQILSLSREAYFDLDVDSEQRMLEEIVKAGAAGIRIGALSEIDPTADSELPVLYLRHTTGLRDWQVEFERNSQLVAVDLSSGEVRNNWAFPTPKRFSLSQLDSSREGDAPTGIAAGATNTRIYHLDARNILNLDWDSGQWALTMVNYDWRSNTVLTRLSSDDADDGEHMSGTSLAEARSLVELLGAAGISRFEKKPESPALDDEGAVLAGPAQVDPSDTSALLRGSLRTHLPSSAIVDAVDGAGDGGIPAAVLSAALLVIKRDELRASRIDLAIPVFSAEPLKTGDVVDAWFELDLADTDLLATVAAGETMLYLVAGEHMSESLAINAEPELEAVK